jgi:hypothetical protein
MNREALQQDRDFPQLLPIRNLPLSLAYVRNNARKLVSSRTRTHTHGWIPLTSSTHHHVVIQRLRPFASANEDVGRWKGSVDWNHRIWDKWLRRGEGFDLKDGTGRASAVHTLLPLRRML